MDSRIRPRKINPRTARISLEPLNITGDRVRFLCIYNGETYKLYMGNKMYRYFTADTLPDLLKERIAMINAFDWDRLHNRPEQMDAYVQQRLLPDPPKP